jgi:hypothetical protein
VNEGACIAWLLPSWYNNPMKKSNGMTEAEKEARRQAEENRNAPLRYSGGRIVRV